MDNEVDDGEDQTDEQQALSDDTGDWRFSHPKV
jgi:hypothetical protein